jgi:hypothetical protein
LSAGTLEATQIDATQIGPVFYADQFSGADSCAKVNAAMSAASSTAIVDARNITGSQTCTTNLNAIPAGVTLLIGNVTLNLPTSNTVLPGQNSYIIGTNQATSQIIGTVSGAGVVQLNNDAGSISYLTIKNTSSTSGSADISVNANHALIQNVTLVNSYVPLYVAQTANAYYGHYINIATGASAEGIVYNSIQIGNSLYQGNASTFELNSSQLAGGTNSCLDNEGSGGILVVGFDCENSPGYTFSAIIDNESGMAEPNMAIIGGYVEIGSTASTNYCVSGTNGFLQVYGMQWQSCNGVTGSVGVGNFGFGGASNAGLTDTSFNMFPGPGGRVEIGGNSSPGLLLQDNLGNPCLNIASVSSEVLGVSDCNNNPATFTFLIYGNEQVVAKATMAASTGTRAGFNLPQGTAPTSPVNGDLWTTSAGLYARINGATVGPYGTGGSGTVTSVSFTGDGVVDSSTPSSAVTSSGTVTATALTQSANTVLAGPSSGSAATPTFRALASADIPTSTWWVAPFFGNASANLSGSTNTIRGWGFTVPAPVTFSNIYAESNTADALGLYSVAIANSSGSLLCHPTTGHNIPTAHAVMTNACGEGSVTIYPGSVYILLTTGNATTGLLQGSGTNGFVLPYYNATMSGCTSASGVITGPCSSVALAAAVNGSSVPSFTLH